MSVQNQLRQARRAMAKEPVQGVLACMAILGRYPGNRSARQLLGRMPPEGRSAVLAAAGRLGEAGHWLEALHLLAPLGARHGTDPALAAAEARCLFQLGRAGDIAARLQAPLAAHPDHPGLLSALGTARQALGAADEAVALLERAAGLAPRDPRIANNLGLARRAMGDIDGARAAFRMATLHSGGTSEAWPNLSQLVDFAQAPDLVPELDAAIARAGSNPARLEVLSFARAKAGFDLGEIETAFNWLELANRLHRQVNPHDAAEDRRRVLALADRLPSGGRAPERRDAPRIVLVVGMPRSGTTLVERILDRHPQVEGLGECPELADMVATLDDETNWTDARLERLAAGYHAALSARRKTGAQVVVDKMPSNALVAGFALAALPGLHVVDVRRDPVATCLSNLRTRYTVSNQFAYDAADIVDRFALTRDCMARWQRRFADRIHPLIYEDLVEAPARWIDQLLRRLGLPSDTACTGFSGASGEVRTASAHQVRGPIRRQPTADWRNLAPFVPDMVESLRPFVTAHRTARGTI